MAIVAKPTDLVLWVPDFNPGDSDISTQIISPSLPKRDDGWLAGEKPAHQAMNYLQNNWGKWLQYLDAHQKHKVSWDPQATTNIPQSADVEDVVYSINGDICTLNGLIRFDNIIGSPTHATFSVPDNAGPSSNLDLKNISLTNLGQVFQIPVQVDGVLNIFYVQPNATFQETVWRVLFQTPGGGAFDVTGVSQLALFINFSYPYTV